MVSNYLTRQETTAKHTVLLQPDLGWKHVETFTYMENEATHCLENRTQCSDEQRERSTAVIMKYSVYLQNM